jgi:hypothetical protein
MNAREGALFRATAARAFQAHHKIVIRLIIKDAFGGHRRFARRRDP